MHPRYWVFLYCFKFGTEKGEYLLKFNITSNNILFRKKSILRTIILVVFILFHWVLFTQSCLLGKEVVAWSYNKTKYCSWHVSQCTCFSFIHHKSTMLEVNAKINENKVICFKYMYSQMPHWYTTRAEMGRKNGNRILKPS